MSKIKKKKVLNYDIVIVRPYITLPNEGGVVARYLVLQKYLKYNGLRSAIYTSTFHHNSKTERRINDGYSEEIFYLNAGTYKKNLSIQRILYELKFIYKVYHALKKIKVSAVLIGEPLFGAGLLAVCLKLKRRVLIFGDFIDLFPEVFKISFKSHLLFNILAWPLIKLRTLRIKVCYNEIFSVSTHFSEKLKTTNSNVYYWGSKYEKIAINNNRRSNKIIYAGSLGAGYDIETVILLAEKRPDLDISIAGNGPKSRMCEQAHKKNTIKYLGQLGSEELKLIYKESSIGIIPYKENSAVSMPVKLFEYISNGLKVVNSLGMECAEIINDTLIGANYISEDIESLEASIDKVINMNVDVAKFNQLSKEYSIDNQYDNFSKAIHKLISK
jgi:glycosyltransferase involved in cell wall biosynthesis